MRVLWLANQMVGYKPHGNLLRNAYNGGGWIDAAVNEIKKHNDVVLGFCSIMDKEPFKSEQDGVIYYPMPSPEHSLIRKVWKKLLYLINVVDYKSEEKSWIYYIDYYKRVVDDFHPDIIHVWGSENFYGLVHKVTDKPVVLHIQGIRNPYFNAFLPPFVSWRQYKSLSRNIKDLVTRATVKRIWKNSAYREQWIIKGIKYYLGRTVWDKRVTHVMNPNSQYFCVDEILREVFYNTGERCIPTRLLIITTISQPLYKGFDMVLKTAKLLKSNFELDFEWKCYGNINPDIVEGVLGIKHEDVNVKLIGVVSAEELREAELEATLYFHPSYIDNSPNSLCEAQILGLPVVATNVGGIPSLVNDGVDGFLVPANDPYQAAYFILLLFNDKAMNIRMGEEARRKALERHKPERVVKQILSVYQNVLEAEIKQQ